jgi:hypothetical protein
MSRITKQIAEDTAKAMTAEKAKEAAALKLKFQQAVMNIAWERVPQEVQNLYASNITNHKNYIVTRREFQLIGYGFDYKWVYVPEPIPFRDCENVVKLSKEEGDLLWQLEKTYKTAEKVVSELKLEIQVTLCDTLRTYKKVEEHFPEAFVHLPKLSTSTALSINLDALRQKIAQ